MRASEFKEAMRTGKTLVGFQQFIPSPALTEMAGYAGYDWAFLCTEHGSLTIGTELENLVRAAQAMELTTIVRVTHNDYPIVMRCLELGADGVMVPRVRTRADVERTVEWVKYPPQGTRGICGFTRMYGYGTRLVPPESVNEETIVMLLIEQVEAFDQLDEILSVPGVDCAMFGAGDLSLELGIRRRMLEGDPEAMEMLNGYRRRFVEACRRHDVAVADIIRDVAIVPDLVKEGVTVFASLPDTSVIQSALATVVQETRRRAAPHADAKALV